jgi:hypothetical protein
MWLSHFKYLKDDKQIQKLDKSYHLHMATYMMHIISPEITFEFNMPISRNSEELLYGAIYDQSALPIKNGTRITRNELMHYLQFEWLETIKEEYEEQSKNLQDIYNKCNDLLINEKDILDTRGKIIEMYFNDSGQDETIRIFNDTNLHTNLQLIYIPKHYEISNVYQRSEILSVIKTFSNDIHKWLYYINILLYQRLPVEKRKYFAGSQYY